MPNWCSNTLCVNGPLREVARFVRENRGKPKRRLSFEKLLPTPDSLLAQDIWSKALKGDFRATGSSGFPDWYTWRLSKWGTKWDLDHSTYMERRDGDEIMYVFDTAWSPPLAWLREASKRYPELVFDVHYEEHGVGFYGNLRIKDSAVLDQEEGNFPAEDDETEETN